MDRALNLEWDFRDIWSNAGELKVRKADVNFAC